MSFLKQLVVRAKLQTPKKNILLLEYQDPRILRAAEKALRTNVANISFLGEPNTIFRHIQNIFPKKRTQDRFHSKLNIITPDDYKDNIYRNVDVGHQLVKENRVDGILAGATLPTDTVLKSALKTIPLTHSTSTLSSFFFMESREKNEKKNLLFADCAVIPSPTVNQLVDISLSTRKSFLNLFGREPKIALLSYANRGYNTGNRHVEKINRTVAILQEISPHIQVDGELQVDVALCPDIAKHKLSSSVIKGDADILIFPDLNAGNIAYKLVERLGNYHAIGPFLQGLTHSTHDLSRGCSVDDIYYTIVLSSLLD